MYDASCRGDEGHGVVYRVGCFIHCPATGQGGLRVATVGVRIVTAGDWYRSVEGREGGEWCPP